MVIEVAEYTGIEGSIESTGIEAIDNLVNKDIGDITALMLKADESQMKSLILACIRQGRFIDACFGYHLLDVQKLQSEGASEQEILALQKANVDGNFEAEVKICSKYDFSPGILNELTFEAYKNALECPASQENGEHTNRWQLPQWISERNTHIGRAYQTLWGADFEGWNAPIPEGNGDIRLVPYKNLSAGLQKIVRAGFAFSKTSPEMNLSTWFIDTSYETVFGRDYARWQAPIPEGDGYLFVSYANLSQEMRDAVRTIHIMNKINPEVDITVTFLNTFFPEQLNE